MDRATFIKQSKYGILQALLFCIPIIFFIKDEQFSQAWLLYLGNALFLACIFILVLIRAKAGGKKISPLNAGLSATFAGIIFSFILTIICILIFAPGLFNIGTANQTLHDTPAALPSNNDHGVLLMLLADIVIGNVVAGSFASVMASAAMRRNKDDRT